MRLSLIVATLSLATLAACSSAPKAPATPVQANQAQAAQGDAAAAPAATDATQQAARPRKKYMNTGSRLPSESPDADPSLGMPASGLSNTTSNTTGGSPH